MIIFTVYRYKVYLRYYLLWFSRPIMSMISGRIVKQGRQVYSVEEGVEADSGEYLASLGRRQRRFSYLLWSQDKSF